MIIQETTLIKISPSNFSYWKEKGYKVGRTGGRAGVNTKNNFLEVKITDLKKNSNAQVKCVCEECHEEYEQRYSRNTNVCGKCRLSLHALGNTLGHAHLGKERPNMRGELHPRWNPSKSEYKKYANEVWRMTRYNYIKHISEINPNDLPRKRCGVEGGYQLDHKISVCQGFRENIDPAIIADVSNLQMLSWECNRSKSHK